ncbi:MAG: hypothetical protein II749_03740 [Clostridia bacterium]|nr:hypothetical protein [Clostridia bacterium]
MKSLKRRFLAVAVVALLVLSVIPSFADGSVSVKVNKSSIEVGDSVSVTITFSGGDSYIAGATASVSYDSSILKYSSVSGGSANISSGKGTIVIETDSTSKSTLSLTLKFTGEGAGSSKISISGTDIVDWDGKTIGSPSGSKTVTVDAKKEEQKEDDKKEDDKKEDDKKQDDKKEDDKKQDDKKQEDTTPKEPTDIEQAIKVSVNGQDRYLWRSLKNVKVPEHFEAKTLVYNGEQIQAASNTALGLNLLYFTDDKGSNGQFLVYNGFENFEDLVKVTENGTEYAVMAKPEDIVLPQGYSERPEKVMETEGVKVFTNMADEDYFYLYLGNLVSGEKGLYLYDRKENSLQRVNKSLLDAKVELENMPEPEPVVEPSVVEPSEVVIDEPVEEPEEKGLIDRILADDGITTTMIAIIGGSAILMALIGSILGISKKKLKQQLKAEKAKNAEKAKTEVSESMEDAEESVEETEDNMEETVSETVEEAEDAVEETAETVTEEISDSAEEALEETAETATETVEDAAEKAEEIMEKTDSEE